MVKEASDIVDVIGSYISLRPAGQQTFKGLCPFHSEKSPSFNVRSSPAFYHCFGCSAGGDVYKFIQEIEHVGFTEAIEKLAEKSGFQLTYEEGSSQETSGRARLLAANQEASAFFVEQLTSPEGDTAVKFLNSRGFDAAAIAQFGIGYAPKGWQGLLDHLKAKGFTIIMVEQKKSAEGVEKMMSETHTAALAEFELAKEAREMANQELAELKVLTAEMHAALKNNGK